LTASYSGDTNNTSAGSSGVSETVVSAVSVSLSPSASYTKLVNTVAHATSCTSSAQVTAAATGGTGQYAYGWQLTQADTTFNLSVSSSANALMVTGTVNQGHTAKDVFVLSVTDAGVSNASPVSTTVTVGIHCESSIQ